MGKKTSNRNKYKNLKDIMHIQGVTQEELARQLKISEPTLNSRLNGRSHFSILEAEKIAQILQIDPAKYFFNSTLRGA